MAKKRTLKMAATDPSGGSVNTSIGYANPKATATVLENFCKAMNGLTKNTYDDTIVDDQQALSEMVVEETA